MGVVASLSSLAVITLSGGSRSQQPSPVPQDIQNARNYEHLPAHRDIDIPDWGSWNPALYFGKKLNFLGYLYIISNQD